MKSLRLYLVGSVLLLIVYVLAEYYKPTPTNWATTYLKEDKIPFGLYILHQEINSIFPNTKVQTSRPRPYNTLKNKNFRNTNYLFIAGSLNFDATDYKELVKFMQQGNHVFIAAFNLGDLLSDTLKLKTASTFNIQQNENTPINFINPALKSAKSYRFSKGLGDWYFKEVDTAAVTVLGEMEYGGMKYGSFNFVKYTFGKGALYILPNPQLLTNYNLLDPAGAEYAAKALSYLPDAETLIWDESFTHGSTYDTSLLQVLLRNPPLRWAYYLSLGGLLIFIFFEIKRRQRIIPVIDPLKNSSVDFVTVVGKVYYQRRDNSDIAHKKINYFFEYIRTNYRLRTTAINEEFMTTVILKSGVSENTIRDLCNTISVIGNSNKVSDSDLIALNKLIEQFYQQAE